MKPVPVATWVCSECACNWVAHRNLALQRYFDPAVDDLLDVDSAVSLAECVTLLLRANEGPPGPPGPMGPMGMEAPPRKE